MAAYSSYYLYQKYEKRGDQDWLPVYPNVFSFDADGTMPRVLKDSYDEECDTTEFAGFKLRTNRGVVYCDEDLEGCNPTNVDRNPYINCDNYRVVPITAVTYGSCSECTLENLNADVTKMSNTITKISNNSYHFSNVNDVISENIECIGNDNTIKIGFKMDKLRYIGDNVSMFETKDYYYLSNYENIEYIGDNSLFEINGYWYQTTMGYIFWYDLPNIKYVGDYINYGIVNGDKRYPRKNLVGQNDTTIKIPESLKYLGKNYNEPLLYEYHHIPLNLTIISTSMTPAAINLHSFGSIDYIDSIIVPSSALSLYKQQWEEYADKIIPE